MRLVGFAVVWIAVVVFMTQRGKLEEKALQDT